MKLIKADDNHINPAQVRRFKIEDDGTVTAIFGSIVRSDGLVLDHEAVEFKAGKNFDAAEEFLDKKLKGMKFLSLTDGRINLAQVRHFKIEDNGTTRAIFGLILCRDEDVVLDYDSFDFDGGENFDEAAARLDERLCGTNFIKFGDERINLDHVHRFKIDDDGTITAVFGLIVRNDGLVLDYEGVDFKAGRNRKEAESTLAKLLKVTK